ncbi:MULTISPECIES: ABC transporter permease [Pseudomonas]|jgi:histidine transport system permease protein|uniref:Amino acid ABC transporter permease n=1 Tax=Pseudomonas oryzihabitans TaxID=47885 RepID=A0A2Z5AAH2_9PSED|nr:MULTISPECIES: ABC transporter permease [Pseudomonas]AXA67557.1 amino acid ABC transporter permease [Pseudomonas oryzihabitans]MBB2895434.1 histidine transport system permease protein [Pseudomonas sp. AS2.8]MDK8263223.1 ABC transporter permease [Pseudomonas oryzihabitans]MDR6178904.1 histidine transport system permease protein [Pseudomonas sp. SORGH_AS_0211]MDR6230970.1 histidine transport system permease protein [Pseudomonas sp. SORGH_AS_0199]
MQQNSFDSFLQSIGLGTLSLHGYGPLILEGTLTTLKLAGFALIVAVILGLLGASAKLSRLAPLRFIAQSYTTLIRGVPDLVLMLLIFYSLQNWLGALTDYMGWDYIDIDPMAAGIATLGFIYGAYFTETFRGAILAVPRGQGEAALAYGLSRWQTFTLITFPQMMRFALPGIGNNWQVLLKATALVSIIGLADLVRASQEAGKGTFKLFYFLIVAGVIYLLITAVTNAILGALERRYHVGVREAKR